MKGLSWWEFALVGLAIVAATVAFPGQGVLAGDNLGFVDAPESPIKLHAGWPIFMGSGDFNEDGNVDLVLVTTQSTEQVEQSCKWMSCVLILFGSGNGKFTPPKRIYETCYSSPSLGDPVVADLNRDGHLDIAITDVTQGIWIFWGSGTGDFCKELLKRSTALLFSRMVSGDFDNDGWPDLAVTELKTRSIYIFWGGEGGKFAQTSKFSFPPNYIPGVPITGVFREGTCTDLAVLGFHTEKGGSVYFVMVLSATRDRDLKLLSTTDVGGPGAIETFVLAAGDYDRDGHLDLITVRNQRMYMLWGKGDGSFAVRRGLTVSDPVVMQVMLADLNGDGCLDVILLGRITGKIFITTGCYGHSELATATINQWSPEVATVTDINNDGVPDMVVGNGVDSNWTYLALLIGK